MQYAERTKEVLSKLIKNIERVVLGKREAVELVVTAFVCNGHVLIEDVPGVAKTILARSLAQSINGKYKRIQFAPDLLPSDVTGVVLYNQKIREFEFSEGPIFANIVLADEINRATPKTQAALLEAMAERQVTVYGDTRVLERPFMVIATQNPIEHEGTFPLPEAQLDRFLLRMEVGYPDRQSERDMLVEQKGHRHPVLDLKPVADLAEIAALQEHLEGIHSEAMIREYIVNLVAFTRTDAAKALGVRLGSSPRGSLALERASRARALLRGRDFVLPEDVQELLGPVLLHRMILKPDYARGKSQMELGREFIAELLQRVPEPKLTPPFL